ncbi:Guanylate cyclase receptor-type gcy-1 [Toxocara canis]|uniref:Guanylate cyclase n=1 Tax=Toxocara canis TaxID=6265 RepID=A0A0B2US18_TOXCA|nr:Guanylate cyclase receptor-type gcy-1 [Toxocara canis]
MLQSSEVIRSPAYHLLQSENWVPVAQSVKNRCNICPIEHDVRFMKSKLKVKMISLLEIAFLCSIAHINEAQFAKNPNYRIKVGMIIPKSKALQPLVGYQRSASAVLIAMDRMRDEQLLPDVNFTFVIKFEECHEHTAVGAAIELITVHKVDVIVGPPCNAPAESVGIITGFHDVINNLWGPTTNAKLSDLPRFPTVATVTGNSLSLGLAVFAIMDEYMWTELAFIYTSSDRCNYMGIDLETAVKLHENLVSITYKQEVNVDTSSISKALQRIRSRARIVLTCFDNRQHFRDLLLAAKDMGMTNDEYVYIFTDTAEPGPAPRPIWQDTKSPSDGRDKEAVEALKYALFVETDNSGRLPLTKEKFSAEVLSRMSEWPFYCSEQECPNTPALTAATYAGHLYDTMYLYAIALNKTIQENDGMNLTHSGARILMNAVGEFDGMTGRVIIGGNGTRDPVYIVRGLNKSSKLDVFLKIRMYTIVPELKRLYEDELSSIWALRNGTRPTTPPRCGYNSTGCPLSFLDEYYGYVICAATAAFIVILFTIFGIAFTIRSKMKEAERANLMWQIPFALLTVLEGKRDESSVRNGSTFFSGLNDHNDPQAQYVSYLLNGEHVVGERHPVHLHLLESDFAELRFMRHFDHENINRFIGLSLDAPILTSVWKYCSRRSIKDVIQDDNLTMDAFFIYSLIKDIASGICALHNSVLRYHGLLTSKRCLIDERWQLKISDYGLKKIRRNQSVNKNEMLWMAPEILRSELHEGTQESDIYSFAIICSELIMRQSVWNIGSRKESAEEIIYLVKRGGVNPMRPDLNLQRYQDLNPSMVHLVKECWNENPNERPRICAIISLLKSMNDRNTNLMDHVFAMLEQHAGTLEAEVEKRTKELIEEKKKSDVLLHRMLPKQVAERLKLGQPVQPESYDCVTVFFSDVVSFTKLAGRCTPLQVVNLLNDLYTAFDGIIDTHDVYKVETIGDGYLCVSGLPKRNGNEHAREIANMSLAFMESLKHYRVPHMPDERINLRIGIHSGPCVAGVVGLTMPRYCLFGDTVNTASRMESSGKAGQIHISADANNFLTRILGGFHTESRGEIIIKGKGVMETFWLLRATDEFSVSKTD